MLINDGCHYDLARIGFCQADVDIAVELAALGPTNADVQDENYLFENFPPYQKADSLNTRRRWAIAQSAVLIAAKAKPEAVRLFGGEEFCILEQ